jgi:hypothetical protein
MNTRILIMNKTGHAIFEVHSRVPVGSCCLGCDTGALFQKVQRNFLPYHCKMTNKHVKELAGFIDGRIVIRIHP